MDDEKVLISNTNKIRDLERSYDELKNTIKVSASDEVKREEVEEQEKNDQEEAKAEFEKITQKADAVLFRAKTVFPFDLFPDEIVIDANKISIIHHTFYNTYHVLDLLIDDISRIEVTTIPFFGSLTIDNKRTNEPVMVSFLWRSDAEKAKRILQGLVITNMERIDISRIEKKEIVKNIEKIGSAKPSFS